MTGGPSDTADRGVRVAVWKLGVLFFWQAAAPALWLVPMGNVFRAQGLEGWIPVAQAASPVAAFISPMILGVLADRGLPVRWLLSGCFAAGSVFLALAFLAMTGGWGGAIMAVFLYAYSLCYQPTWSLMTSVVMTQLTNVPREFPAVRVWATLGWMGGALAVSMLLHADASPTAGFAAAATAAGVAGLAWVWLRGLPAPPALAKLRHWSQWLGSDAWRLLRDPEHRPVFIGAALLGAPIMSFYPYTPIQLAQFGSDRPSAVMSIAQITEIVVMFAMPWLLGAVRLRWLFLAGLMAATLRFALFTVASTLETSPLLVTGIPLHGILFVLYYITAQIYVEQRVDRSILSQAQALLSLMGAGFGSLAGAVLCGWWRTHTRLPDGSDNWPQFWGGLTLVMAAVTLWFALTYRGRPLARGS